MNLFQFTRIVVRLARRIGYQKNYNNLHLYPLLNKVQREFGEQLDDVQLKKMTHYYCLLVPPVLCENFTRITGREMTEEERYKAMLMGINTPLFDDFFDSKEMTGDEIKQITHHPEAYPAQNISEYTFSLCHNELLNTVKHPGYYREMTDRILEAQYDSQSQFDPHISEEQLTRITFEKGMYSLLIYHSILDDQPSEAIKKLTWQLSGLMQLTNDIFDIYKDLVSGITTLPNRSTDFSIFRKYFIKECIQLNKLAHALPYKRKRIIHFIVAMQLVISRGLVALDQLEKLKDHYSLPLKIAQVPREELICDMELWSNRLSWMRYAYQMSKKE